MQGSDDVLGYRIVGKTHLPNAATKLLCQINKGPKKGRRSAAVRAGKGGGPHDVAGQLVS